MYVFCTCISTCFFKSHTHTRCTGIGSSLIEVFCRQRHHQIFCDAFALPFLQQRLPACTALAAEWFGTGEELKPATRLQCQAVTESNSCHRNCNSRSSPHGCFVFSLPVQYGSIWSSNLSSNDVHMFCLSNACVKVNEKHFSANGKMIHGTAGFASFPCKQGLLLAMRRHGMSWLLQVVTIAKYNTKGQQFLPGSQ